MKVVCPRESFNEALSLASGVVPQRTTIPAITNLKVTAKKGKGGGTLEICGTDLEYGLRYTLPEVEVKEEGTVVLPAARIAGIVRESGDNDVTLDSDGTLAHVRTKTSAFKVVGIDPVDYPEIPAFDEKNAFEIDTKNLSEMIRKTGIAVSLESVRYALTGQLVEIKGKEIRMVASDGKRLAYMKSRSTGKAGTKDLRVIVPTKTLGLLSKVLTPQDETVLMRIEETQVQFRTSRAVIFSRLIEGSFPDYEAVVPADRDQKAEFDRVELLAAVRRVALMTSDKTRAIQFRFSKKGRAILFTRTPDVGEATVDVAVQYDGDSLDIVFNPDYVLDYLKVVDDERVELHLKDKTSAGLFRSGKDFVYVLMPLTVTL